MIRYRFFTIAPFAAALALSFVLGCPSAAVVDGDTSDVESPPGQVVDDGPSTEPLLPGQGDIDNPIDSVPPPIPPDDVPDLGGIPDAGAVNPQPPTLGQLFPGQAYRVGENPVNVTSGDLDGDGDLDLAVANLAYGNISILLGNGSGAFSTPVNYGTGNHPSSIEMGDLDGDGDLDLAVLNRDFRGILSILRNDGDGIFAAAVNYDVGDSSFISFMGMADLDGDGDLDLAVSTMVSDSTIFFGVPVITFLLNDGDGIFAAADEIGEGSPSLSRVTGDLDSDGGFDLVVFLGDGEDTSALIIYDNGDAASSNATAILGAGGGFVTAAGDVDGDGDLDFVTHGDAELRDMDGDGDLDLALIGDGVKVFLNNGDGTFATGMTFISQPASDGFLIRDGVAVFLNDGDGTFVAAAKYQTGQEPNSVTAGDWDGDGDVDLAVTNFQTDDVSVLLNNGNGTFLAALNFAAVGLGSALGDLDGDGDLDLAGLSPTSIVGVFAISILLNNGNGIFAPTESNAVVPFGATSITMGDLDGDGDLDLAVPATASDDDAFFGVVGAVSIFRNNGDGTFATPVSFETNSFPLSVATCDLDGDGDLDLAVTSDSPGDTGVVSILLNNGEGSFASAVNYPAGDQSLSIDTGDLDGDGDLDLAVANSDDVFGGVSILLNNGDATFAATVNYGTRTLPKSVVIGDFDGDGSSDLAVTDGSLSTGAVSILLNNGDGTFAAAVDFGTGAGKQNFLTTGDLDGDGDLDLALSNQSDTFRTGSVSVLLGNGDGTFQEAMNFVIGTGSGSVRMGDLDTDGDLDLAVRTGFGVSILFNQIIP